MAGTNDKRFWILLVFILCGIVIGSLLGELASNVNWLSSLAFSRSFGLSTPLTLDLGVIQLTFGLMININMASMIGVLIALIVYRYI
jgi:hypothetical protein